ncbi:ejaculatory bulb-specific protein 3-like [Topomyia yanbarensis]|uniref:ejaculatory bulb-specific protein 3-like n=1 Tax=Topomyia yanbarensis TaxID=2498891 RepID=UPI00273C3C70|nr:ejaculatory bulb-specific protein 3-like [Topomyia yanbarensis]
MKLILLIAGLMALAAAQEDRYTNRFDNIDLDEILKSDRLFKNYFQCLTDMGRCTPEGKELKRVLPEALAQSCAKCSQKQREAGDRAFKYLSENRPEEWKILRARYDPENKYATNA